MECQLDFEADQKAQQNYLAPNVMKSEILSVTHILDDAGGIIVLPDGLAGHIDIDTAPDEASDILCRPVEQQSYQTSRPQTRSPPTLGYVTSSLDTR